MSASFQAWDIGKLNHVLVGHVDGIRDYAKQALEDAVNEALMEFARVLDHAVTQTGADRAASGGHPGRFVTGLMEQRFTFKFDEDSPSTLSAVFGWIDGVEDYFVYQEYGTGRQHAPDLPTPAPSAEAGGSTPPMHGLLSAYVKARETLHSRLRDLGFRVD